MTSTGTPPHIESARMCRQILEKCDETLERVQNIETTVKEAVKEAYEEKQAKNGHLSAESMKGIFKKFESDMKRNVQAEIKDVRGDIQILMTMAASGNAAKLFEKPGPTNATLSRNLFDTKKTNYCRTSSIVTCKMISQKETFCGTSGKPRKSNKCSTN